MEKNLFYIFDLFFHLIKVINYRISYNTLYDLHIYNVSYKIEFLLDLITQFISLIFITYTNIFVIDFNCLLLLDNVEIKMFLMFV